MVFIEIEVSSSLLSAHKMVGFASIPQWLEGLLSDKFFNSCLVHEYEKKNDVNTFCVDCCISLCRHCFPPHQTHHLLQIRRYVYQDVIRLKDAERLMDCSFVQSYITNSAKVVFLNQRPLARQFKGSGCIICDRNLQDPYLFCSIACKVRHMVSSKVNLIKQHFYKYESSLELEDGHMIPESVLEFPLSLLTSSGSSSSSGANNTGAMNCKTPACTAATTEFVKKKRSTVSISLTRYQPKCFSASEMAAPRKPRKGVPHRSPM